MFVSYHINTLRHNQKATTYIWVCKIRFIILGVSVIRKIQTLDLRKNITVLWPYIYFSESEDYLELIDVRNYCDLLKDGVEIHVRIRKAQVSQSE
jgi:hypothetical protein